MGCCRLVVQGFCGKNLAKNEEKPCSTSLQPIFRPYHYPQIDLTSKLTKNFFIFILDINCLFVFSQFIYICTHPSEKRGLHSTKCSSKMLQNLLYFMYKKTHVVVFFIFHFIQLWVLPNECPGLCQHRPGHSLGKNIKLHKMKNEKSTWVFLYIKYSKFWSVSLGH